MEQDVFRIRIGTNENALLRDNKGLYTINWTEDETRKFSSTDDLYCVFNGNLPGALKLIKRLDRLNKKLIKNIQIEKE